MRRAIVLTIAAVLSGGAALGAEQHGKGNKHHGEAETAQPVSAAVSWRSHDVEIVRQYYAPKHRSLPPGLQKKYERTGQLPPGWQKKMEPLPVAVERECAPLPAGYRRGIIEGHAVIYTSRGAIIDVAVLF